MINIKLQTCYNEDTDEKEYKYIKYNAGSIYPPDYIQANGDTCIGCNKLITIDMVRSHRSKEVIIGCMDYPAMKNQVRCIQYSKV